MRIPCAISERLGLECKVYICRGCKKLIKTFMNTFDKHSLDQILKKSEEFEKIETLAAGRVVLIESFCTNEILECANVKRRVVAQQWVFM